MPGYEDGGIVVEVRAHYAGETSLIHSANYQRQSGETWSSFVECLQDCVRWAYPHFCAGAAEEQALHTLLPLWLQGHISMPDPVTLMVAIREAE